jgi:hypothetical protein
MDYASTHNGEFPAGNSSTEVFQKLIDDRDIKSNRFFFDLPGKKIAQTNKISSENVCFDFSQGTNANSPDWVPIVFPTGYSLNYHTGEALMLPSNSLHDKTIRIVYVHDSKLYSIMVDHFYFFRTKKLSLSIMPGKPGNADVSQYHQLTPDGRL